MTSACGSKGIQAEDKTAAEACVLPYAECLGCLFLGRRRGGWTGWRVASLGTTWLFRNGARPSVIPRLSPVDATQQTTPDSHGRPFGNSLYGRLNGYLFFLPTIDRPRLLKCSQHDQSVSEPRVRVARVTKGVD